MPREMTPSVIYFVRGEGVRDNSWEAQQPAQPVQYTNPPIEQLDSVPTPFGADLSIRIFEKGTKPIPDFLPSAEPIPPVASVVAAEAPPMPPAVSSKPKTPVKTPSASAALLTMPRPSSSTISAPLSSSKTPKPVVQANSPAAVANVPAASANASAILANTSATAEIEPIIMGNATVASKSAPATSANVRGTTANASATAANKRDTAISALHHPGSGPPPKPPRLRNFRGSLIIIIADPREIPGAKSTAPTAMPASSSQQAQQPRPAPSSAAQKPAVQPKVSPVSTKAPLATVSKRGPLAQKPRPRTPVASIAPVVAAPVITPMALSPPRTGPSASVKPTTPPISAPSKVHVSPPIVKKGAPSVPELPIPSPSSPDKSLRTQQQVTSPSTFGRWKTSSPVSPSERIAPSLPSPTKQTASGAAEKSRAKPWDKHKSSAPTQINYEVQRKAMANICEKALSHQSKPTKILPPLAPLTPPAPRPSQAGPVSPRVPPTKAAPLEDVPSKRHSSSPPKPRTAVRPPPKKPESVKGVAPKPRRPIEKPAQPRQERPVVDVRKEGGKEDAMKATVKTPALDPVSKPKEAVRMAPMTAPPKQSERKLLEKEIPKPSNAIRLDASSPTGPSADASTRTVTVKPSMRISTPNSISEKKGTQSVKATSDARPATSPRSSIDGYEIGTAARPIVTKEDQDRARRKREVAAAGASKAPQPSEKPAQRKSSSNEVHKGKEQRAFKAVAGTDVSISPSLAKNLTTTESSDLFSSEIQESMKSVIEQILWTVRHYKQRYAISNHDEMKSNKQKILRFIQIHLEGAVTAPQKKSLTQGPEVVGSGADHAIRRQSSLKGKESAQLKNDLRDIGLNDVRTYEMFKSWRRYLEQVEAPLQNLVIESRQLRQRVTSLDRGILYFTAADLLKRLRELEELDFPIGELSRRLGAAGKEITVHKSTDPQIEEEFQDSFRIIRSVARWLLFLSDQASLMWKKLQKSPMEAAEFAGDVYDAVLKESTTGADETSARKGTVKKLRVVKSMVGNFQNELDLGHEGVSFCEVVAESVKTLGKVCREGLKWREQGMESAAAPPVPHQDRPATKSPTVRSAAVPRRPRHEDKQENNQESRNIKGRTSGSGSAAAAQSNATEKPVLESRARARTPNGSSSAVAGPKGPTSQKSLPGVPRRPPVAEAPGATAAGQASSSTQKGAGNVPRWLTADRPNLRTLMEKSARPVDQIQEDKPRDSVQGGSKRKAEENPDQNGLDEKPAKKRRVKFAPVLVQGEQPTPHSYAALQSLFFDGYDLLGDTTELQQIAVEERASQLSRGSVIATFGFIRSYISALKAEKDGEHVQRPEWVRLPYTPTMKKDIMRFNDRGGNGLRSAPGHSLHCP